MTGVVSVVPIATDEATRATIEDQLPSITLTIEVRSGRCVMVVSFIVGEGLEQEICNFMRSWERVKGSRILRNRLSIAVLKVSPSTVFWNDG